jgi:hypothetical protein
MVAVELDFNTVFKYKIGQTIWCRDSSNNNYKTYKVTIVNRNICEYGEGLIALSYGCNNANDVYIEFNEQELYLKENTI